MRTTLLIGLALAASPAFAQLSQTPGVPEPKDIALPRDEQLVAFDPNAAVLKLVGGKWQVWAGEKPLKDFGRSQADAMEALRVIRELQLTHLGTVAEGTPPVEYWLRSGKAPEAGSFRRVVRPFDPGTLRVAGGGNTWVLADKTHVLFAFGADKASADQALGVCQKYGFNQVVYVGQVEPKMVYFVFDRTQGPGTVREPGALDAIREAAALPASALSLPKLGYVGDHFSIDSRKLEVRLEGRDWILQHGKQTLGTFGGDRTAADDTLRMLRDWRVNEYCRVGAQGVTFFLVNGRAPRGMPLTLRSTPFSPKDLGVREVAGSWAVTDGPRVLYDFGPDREEAELVRKVLQHFGFDHLATMGHPLRPGMRLLVKDR